MNGVPANAASVAMPWRAALGALIAFGAAGAASVLLTFPERLWPVLLLSGFYALSLALGSALFLAVQGASAARWSRGFHRVPEMLASALWPGAALVLAALFFGSEEFHGWAHQAGEGHHAHHGREVWLSTPFLLGRAVFYILVWSLLIRRLVRLSREERETPSPALAWALRKTSAGFLVAFALTFSLACFDWLMALEPHWFSTMFAVYMFAGTFLASLGALAVMLVLMKRAGAVSVSADEFHDLGKLTFGFSTFWAYIWFCQFLLIWYTNIPEETPFFASRHAGGWTALSFLNVALHWTLPFLALMMRAMKRSETALLRVGLVLLFAHALDLYIVVMPNFTTGGAPSLAPWAAAVFLGAAALFARAIPRIPK